MCIVFVRLNLSTLQFGPLKIRVLHPISFFKNKFNCSYNPGTVISSTLIGLIRRCAVFEVRYNGKVSPSAPCVAAAKSSSRNIGSLH